MNFIFSLEDKSLWNHLNYFLSHSRACRLDLGFSFLHAGCGGEEKTEKGERLWRLRSKYYMWCDVRTMKMGAEKKRKERKERWKEEGWDVGCVGGEMGWGEVRCVVGGKEGRKEGNGMLWGWWCAVEFSLDYSGLLSGYFRVGVMWCILPGLGKCCDGLFY